LGIRLSRRTTKAREVINKSLASDFAACERKERGGGGKRFNGKSSGLERADLKGETVGFDNRSAWQRKGNVASLRV